MQFKTSYNTSFTDRDSERKPPLVPLSGPTGECSSSPPLIFTPLTLCGGTTRPDTPTTLVACGWAGAVFELLEQLGRGSEAPDCENNIASHPRITHGHWSVIPNALFRVIKWGSGVSAGQLGPKGSVSLRTQDGFIDVLEAHVWPQMSDLEYSMSWQLLGGFVA